MSYPIHGRSRHRAFAASYEMQRPFHTERQRSRATTIAREQANRVYDLLEDAAIEAASAAGNALRGRFGDKVADHVEGVTFHAAIECIEFLEVPE